MESDNPFAEGNQPHDSTPSQPARPQPAPPKPDPGKTDDPFNTQIDPGDGSISYMGAWTYLTEGENWTSTWLLLSLVALLPYIGQIVVQGYMFNSFEGVLRGYRTHLPEYRFDRFGEDLKRGIWPWLVAFVIGAGMQVIIQPVSHVSVLAIVAVGQNMDEETAVLFLAFFIPLVILVTLALSLGVACILTPMYLRAGLAQTFKDGFNFRWSKQFVSLVWFELIMARLFLGVSGLLAMLIGIGFCFFGFIFTITFILVASMYLDMQLYRLFLLRGGEPVPLKPPSPQVADSWLHN